MPAATPPSRSTATCRIRRSLIATVPGALGAGPRCRRRAAPPAPGEPAADVGRRSFYTLLNSISDERITPMPATSGWSTARSSTSCSELHDLQPLRARHHLDRLRANETGIPYDRIERRHGQKQVSAAQAVRFALDGIFGHSIVPLRLATYVGLLTSHASPSCSACSICCRVLSGVGWPSGFATTRS